MLTRRSLIKSSAIGLGAAILGSTPSIALADEELCSDEDRLSLLASSLKAGSSASKLKNESGGVISVDFSNLPQSTFTSEWADASLDCIESLLAAIPQALSDSDDDQLCDAQASAIAYAVDRARWSVDKGRASNLGSETVYMYLSHFIDVGDNYWTAGNASYLTSGPSRSDVQPYYAQWLQATDRSSYSTYLRATTGTAKIGEIANVADGILSGVDFLKNDALRAARSLYMARDANELGRGALGAMAEEHQLEDASDDLMGLIGSFVDMARTSSDVQMEYLVDSFRGKTGLEDKYSDITLNLAEGAAIAIGGTYFLGGGLVGVLGTAAASAVSSAAILSAYMASDFFSRTAWLVLRYGWSGRYAERLSERLFS